MKILHVIWSAEFGGAEVMLIDIVNFQVRIHEVSLLIINDVVQESLLETIDPKVRLIRLNRPVKSRNPYYIIRLNTMLFFQKADVVHFHQDNIIRYVPVRHFRNNLCLTLHSVRMEGKYLPLYDHLFCISPVVQEKLINVYGLESFLVLNGVNCAKIKQADNFRISPEIWRLVQVGRLDHACKGQDILLQALRLLIDKYNVTTFHLDLIGIGSSEDYLRSLCLELGLQSHVTFKGGCSKKYIEQHLCEYDLLVQPSRWEGFGLTVVEAMAARVLVLVSDIDSFKVNTNKGKNAFVFKSEEADNLATMMRLILHFPEEKKQEMRQEAYSFTLENFDVSKTAQGYLDCYEEIIEQRCNSK